MQTFHHAGKPRFIVSNRVFWAAVVLAAAALLGRNTGQAAPPIPDEIKARALTLVDDAGHTAITMGASSNDSAIIVIGAGGKSGKLKSPPTPNTEPPYFLMIKTN